MWYGIYLKSNIGHIAEAGAFTRSSFYKLTDWHGRIGLSKFYSFLSNATYTQSGDQVLRFSFVIVEQPQTNLMYANRDSFY